jgi:hypothetical protein
MSHGERTKIGLGYLRASGARKASPYGLCPAGERLDELWRTPENLA